MHEVRIGAVSVDLATGRLSDGQRLRPLELRILELLCRTPGEVVSSETLTEALGYGTHTNTHTLYTTIYRLRSTLEPDPTNPVHVVAVRGRGYRIDGVHSEAGPPAAEGPITNLGPEFDEFVGRQELLSQIAAVDAPLITLIGPGGSGKSRLARRYLASVDASGGIWWVPLSEIGADGVIPALHEAARATGPPRLDAVLGALRVNGPAVVCLDNAEHLLGPVTDLVGAVRHGAPETRILVTSRTPLSVVGERLIEVTSMPLQEAVELMRTRVAESRPGWVPDDPRVLTDLVDRLDRLPLAIELAAARLWTHSPAALLDQLDQRIALWSSRTDRPARHRSLDAVLGWTWDQCSDWEREALGRLAVVDGPFGIEVASVVLGPRTGPAGLDAASVLVHLHQIGVVSTSSQTLGRPFSVLQTVRQAVLDRTPDASKEETRERLIGWVAKEVLDRVDGPPTDHDRSDWPLTREVVLGALRRRLDQPLDPGERARLVLGLSPMLVRTPLERAERRDRLAAARVPDLPRELDDSLRLEQAHADHGDGKRDQALAECEALLDDPLVSPVVRARAGYALVSLLPSYDQMGPMLDRSDRALAEVPEKRRGILPGVSSTLRALGEAVNGRCEAAVALHRDAWLSFRAAGAPLRAARAQSSIGHTYSLFCRWEEAVAALTAAEASLAYHDSPAARREHARIAGRLGRAWAGLDLVQADRWLQIAVDEARRWGPAASWFESTVHLAEVDLYAGRIDRSLARVADAARVAPLQPANARMVLLLVHGLALGAADRLDHAEAVLRETMVVADELGGSYIRTAVRAQLAELLAAADRHDEAWSLIEEGLDQELFAPTRVAAEILRRQGRQAEALSVIQSWIRRSTTGRVGDLLIAAALEGALLAELGRGPPPPPLPGTAADPDGTIGAWVAIAGARVDRATGGPGELSVEVPLHDLLARRAAAELGRR